MSGSSAAIVVTGGAGFIGANIVAALNRTGLDDIVVVDDLSDGRKFRNISDCSISDYFDKEEYLELLTHGRLPVPAAMFHQGACSTTTEWDGRMMMRNNYTYSKTLLHYCVEHQVPFIYASSASVYGAGPNYSETPEHEQPLNVYGYSKLQFDRYVRRLLPIASSQIVGLRYFNVYGPREAHKDAMASVVWHVHRQVEKHGEARLFEGSGGYAAGEQRRDFVHVDDVVAVNLWFLEHSDCNGIYNVGTGRAQSFNELARAVIDWHGRGKIRYIPFPPELEGSYQSFTEADLTALRGAGFAAPFADVGTGVRAYLDAVTSPAQ